MDAIWQEMYRQALTVLKPREVSDRIYASKVVAAVESASGNIYLGASVDSSCSLGVCAERNAIFNMITHDDCQIKRVLPLRRNGTSIKPCGACRELMSQVMPENYRDIEIMLDYDTNKIVTLGDLTPEWWLDK